MIFAFEELCVLAKWAFYGLILFSLKRAMADPCGPQNFSQMGFEPIIKLAKVLPTLSAGVNLRILGSDGEWGSCSGSVVSDDGTILTASHCLEDCQNPNQNGIPECVVEIDGKRNVVEVNVASPCTYKDHEKEAALIPPTKCSRASDVAVIVPESKLDHACLPLSSDYEIGQAVYTVGRPFEPSNRGKNDVDGIHSYASFGAIIPHNMKCTLVQDSMPDDAKYGKPLGGAMDMSTDISPAMTDGTIQTTVDILHGSSGGPLINPQGEIIGVASFTSSRYQTRWSECQGGTFFVPITSVNSTNSVIQPLFDMSNLKCNKGRIRPPH